MDDFVEIEKAHYTFPERLMELLEGEKVKEAMWWLPGGCAFAIRPKIFYDAVLSKYFQGTKFESFTRKLNRWGFRRLASQGVPQSTIAYYNTCFKKGQPHLLKNMRSGNKGKFNEAEKPHPASLVASVPTTAAQTPFPVPDVSQSIESTEMQSLREYLKNQSIVAARQSQQAAALRAQTSSKEQDLLASLQQQQGEQAFATPPLSSHGNLVAMQRRARLQAAQQMAAMYGPGGINNFREALFSRVGAGLLDTPPPPRVGEGLNPQMLELLLLRQRLGQSGMM